MPTAGLPVGDSVSFADTVQWSNAPATNPYTWCDTATVYRSGIAMTDPTPANNQKCKTIPFVQQPASINDFVAENSLVVYPNPATSNLNVSYNLVNSAKSVTVTIRNLVGQAVYTEEVKDNTRGGKQVSINLNNIPSGLYTAELNVDGAKITNKFSVAK